MKAPEERRKGDGEVERNGTGACGGRVIVPSRKEFQLSTSRKEFQLSPTREKNRTCYPFKSYPRHRARHAKFSLQALSLLALLFK